MAQILPYFLCGPMGPDKMVATKTWPPKSQIFARTLSIREDAVLSTHTTTTASNSFLVASSRAEDENEDENQSFGLFS